MLDDFLEHTRIYWFHHNGENKVFLSSADMMTRNMVKRVEILFPIYANDTKERVMNILLTQLADNLKARVQDATGRYYYKDERNSTNTINSQELFIEEAMSGVIVED